MRRHALPAMEDFDGAPRGANFDVFADARARDAVEAVLEGDVVVDVDLGLLPLAALEAVCRQGAHCGPIDALNGGPSAARQPLEGTSVELLELLGDGSIELGEIEECAMTKPRQNPALSDEQADLDLRLVLRFARSRRDDGDAVVPRHLQVRRIDLRVVSVGSADRAPKLIRNEDLRHASEVLEPANGRLDEVGCALSFGGLDERVVARAEHHHEELDGTDLSGSAVDELRRLAGVVDERLLAGVMCLSHRQRELRPPLGVQVAELAVLVGSPLIAGSARGLLVLETEELERDAGASQLAVNPLEVDRNAR